MGIWQDAFGALHDDGGGTALSLPYWPQGMTLLTDAQVEAIRNPPPAAAQLAAALKVQAQAALDKSDTTIIRCFSAGIAAPAAWQAYRTALRAIVSGADTTSTVLPATPPYPEGT